MKQPQLRALALTLACGPGSGSGPGSGWSTFGERAIGTSNMNMHPGLAR